MKRFAEESVGDWYKSPNRKPLIVRGARQVGKSTLVRQFCESEKLKLCEINLERHPQLNTTFQTLDLSKIIPELEAITDCNLKNKHTILFLDEIQATPYAIQALRYFYENFPELPVIAAGSLLEFTLKNHTFSMPVGRVQYFYLGPVTFEELVAEKFTNLLNQIQSYSLDRDLPQAAHQRLTELFRRFIFVGGMPESVHHYLIDENFKSVQQIQQNILATYQDDFSKYTTQSELTRLQTIYKQIPLQVGKKVKYSNFSREERSREIKQAIELLNRAGIVDKVFHSHCSGIPLGAEVDENLYKLLFLDIGLMNNACGLDWLSISNLENQKLVNEGPIAEQVVGQHLIRKNENSPPTLQYWVREGKSQNAEVDYVISQGDLIIPVEVKSGKSGSLKSLLQFVYQHKCKLAIRFDLNPPSIQKVTHQLRQKDSSVSVEVTLISLPLYMVGQTSRLINEFRAKES